MAVIKLKAKEKLPALEINSETIEQLSKFFAPEKVNVLKGNLEAVEITLDSISFDKASKEVIMNFSNDIGEEITPIKASFEDFANKFGKIEEDFDILNVCIKDYVKAYVRKLALIVFYRSIGAVILDGLTIKGLHSADDFVKDININFCTRGVTISNIPKEYGSYTLIHSLIMGVEIEIHLNNHIWTERPVCLDGTVVLTGDMSMVNINDFTDLGETDDILNYPHMFEDLEQVPDYDDIEPVIHWEPGTILVRAPRESDFVLVNSPEPLRWSRVNDSGYFPRVQNDNFDIDVDIIDHQVRRELPTLGPDPIEHEDISVTSQTETVAENKPDSIDWDF